MKTVDVGVKGKASLSADVEDLFKFKNEILSAQANKAITSDEAFRMWGNIYGPFTGKIVHNNNDALWQKMSKINNYQKVDEFQAASHVLKEYLIRTGGDSDPSIKSKMYDAYFKAAETKLKPGVFNSKGVPYTPEELAHSVVGEGIGSMYQTKFGPREITKYNKQTGSPMVDLTKEDLESLGNKAALAELQKGRS